VQEAARARGEGILCAPPTCQGPQAHAGAAHRSSSLAGCRPAQPSASELEADPLRHRFTVVFDREGYSPDLFARLENQHRIAILTYHKHPGPDWAQSEFSDTPVTLVNGERVSLSLAERGTCLSNGHWLREIRKRDARSGQQTAILSTDYRSESSQLAAAMFARWHQENFFKYMRQNFGLDRLVEQGTSPLPDTTRIVNPAWRALESQVRSTQAKLSRAQAQFTAQSLLTPQQNTPEAAARHEQRQGSALEQVQQFQAQLAELKAKRKAQAKHVQLKDLPEGQRIEQLRSGRKQLIQSPPPAPSPLRGCLSAVCLAASRSRSAHGHHQTHCLPGREHAGAARAREPVPSRRCS